MISSRISSRLEIKIHRPMFELYCSYKKRCTGWDLILGLPPTLYEPSCTVGMSSQSINRLDWIGLVNSGLENEEYLLLNRIIVYTYITLRIDDIWIQYWNNSTITYLLYQIFACDGFAFRFIFYFLGSDSFLNWYQRFQNPRKLVGFKDSIVPKKVTTSP